MTENYVFKNIYAGKSSLTNLFEWSMFSNRGSSKYDQNMGIRHSN
jgi:hypothetical protein